VDAKGDMRCDSPKRLGCSQADAARGGRRDNHGQGMLPRKEGPTSSLTDWLPALCQGRGGFDPDIRGAGWRLGETAGEALGVHAIGRGQHSCPCRHPLLGQAVVHVGGRQQPKAGVMIGGVDQGKNPWQCPRTSWMEPNRSGNAGADPAVPAPRGTRPGGDTLPEHPG